MIEFGTGGFRGVIADDFNKRNLKLIAEAVSVLYKKKNYNKPIYIGYDYRFMSDYAAKWIAETLASNNIKVYLSKTNTTTPEIMYICKELCSEFGIMITASHNPYIFNGVKLFQDEGMDAEKSLTDEVEKVVNSLSTYHDMDFDDAVKEEKIRFIDIHDSFIQNIMQHLKIKNESHLKILIDPIFGTGSITLKKLVEQLNLKNVTFINDTHDALFNNRLPNPTKANMELDASKIVNEHFDLGIGLDSDCDRLAILDENGRYVDANEILASLYYYLVKYRNMKGDIVKNLATSILIDKVADKLNYKCHEVDVGFKNISSAIKKHDALIGGESSGGLTIRNYIFGKDSTFSAALFLEMVINMNKKVSEIIEEVKEFANYNYVILEGEKRYKNKELILNECEKSSPKFTLELVNKVKINNNYKYYFKDGSWALLRFSGTEPLIRIFTEMPNKEIAEENLKIINDYIESIEFVSSR